MIKSIKEIKEIRGKRILLRADFNVPFNGKGFIEDNFRIRKSLPTIEYLASREAKVILISHRGRPNGKDEKYSLKPIRKELENLLKKKVGFLDDCLGKDIKNRIEKMVPGEIILLENLRFYPGEESNNQEFAKELSRLADFYVNDAFSVSHRDHASITSLPKYLPSAAGLLLAKEISFLEKVKENPKRPLVAVVGGAKVSSKIRFIGYFLKEADQLLIGGKVANIILGEESDKKIENQISGKIKKEIAKIDARLKNVYLPVDFLKVSDKGKNRVEEIGLDSFKQNGDVIFDIGPKTIKIFSGIIEKAKTIIWAGPLGFFENSLFQEGTKLIGRAITNNKKAFKLAGGGDTVSAISKFNLENGFSYISTGGSALLAFFSEKELPGLKALENYN